MLVRNRRARLSALALFLVFAVVLYTRSGSSVQDYKDYAAKLHDSAVGGGSVRPKPADEGENKARPDQAAGPLTEEPAPAPATTHDEATSAKSTPVVVESASRSTEASTSTSTSTAAPVPTLDPAAAYDLTQAQQGLPAITYDDDVVPYAVGQGRVEVNKEYQTPIHWTKLPQHFPVNSTIQLPTSSPTAIPKVQHAFKSAKNKGADMDRLVVIKAAAVHAWEGYREKAWGQDEIKPVSGESNNPFNGWGATLVDGLDTLWIMDMKAEFDESVQFVETIDFTTSARSDIPMFETTIRYLGGLLAAYDVSGHTYRILLHKAVELAEVLYGAFDTPNRMPDMYYRWKPTFASQPHRASTRAVLAELGSLGMEFTRLAQLTGEPKYYDAIARITDAFDEFQDHTRLPGMWPTYVDASGCAKPAMMPAGSLAGPGPHMMAPDGKGEMQADHPVAASSFQDLNRASEESVKEHYETAMEKEGADVGTIEDSSADPAQQQEADHLAMMAEQANQAKEGETADTTHAHRKRQLDGLPTDANGNMSPPKVQQPQAGLNPCIPQGLASPNQHSSETYTLAGMSDSTYEYLPKMQLLLGGTTSQYATMYAKSARTAIDKLLYRPMINSTRDILVAGDLSVHPNTSSPTGEMIESFRPVGSHLVCFAGGMFALGGAIFNRPEDLEVGKKLTDGCIWAYNVTTTGIMPEDFTLSMCEDKENCEWDEAKWWEELDPYREQRTRVTTPAAPKPAFAEPVYNADLNKRQIPPSDPANHLPDLPKLPPSPATDGSDSDAAPPMPAQPVYTPPPPVSHEEYVAQKIANERLPPGFTRLQSRAYILRPEAIESVFYLYRITGDEYWRERGWEMFVAIQDHTRSMWGNSAVGDVTVEAPELKDSEESFWIAETLKYFYLLFDEPERFSLDEWVLNTEAHFFKRPAADDG